MEGYEERRKHERYDLVLPCLLNIIQDDVVSNVVEIKTRNISAGGVFLDFVRNKGHFERAKVDILISPDIIKSNSACGTFISANGKIVRSEKNGTALLFSESYRIGPLDEVLRYLKKKLVWLVHHRRLMNSELQSMPKFSESDFKILKQTQQ